MDKSVKARFTLTWTLLSISQYEQKIHDSKKAYHYYLSLALSIKGQ
jgi:hypothetical protein